MNDLSWVRAALRLAAFLAVSIGTAFGQYMRDAVIRQSASKLTVESNEPRPLEQALIALTQRFGWRVDYQDPVYAPEEAKDIAAPEWRRKHPHEIGFLAPSGGLFSATLDSFGDLESNYERALVSLLNQYNESSNPGEFRLQKTSQGRLAVIGKSRTRSASDPMEALVKSDGKSKSAGTALQDLVSRCTQSSGVQMEVGIFPNNAVAQTTFKEDTQPSSCRTQLEKIVASIQVRCNYYILYDIGSATYVWSILPIVRTLQAK